MKIYCDTCELEINDTNDQDTCQCVKEFICECDYKNNICEQMAV